MQSKNVGNDRAEQLRDVAEMFRRVQRAAKTPAEPIDRRDAQCGVTEIRYEPSLRRGHAHHGRGRLLRHDTPAGLSPRRICTSPAGHVRQREIW
jgi:hypothetical protein